MNWDDTGFLLSKNRYRYDFSRDDKPLPQHNGNENRIQIEDNYEINNTNKFNNSLFILSGVMSNALENHAIVDAGLKSMTVDSGLPKIFNNEIQKSYDKVQKILKGSLDSIPSPSPSMKIQIMDRKVCLRCKGKTLLGVVNKLLKTKSLLTSPSNVLMHYLKETFPPII